MANTTAVEPVPSLPDLLANLNTSLASSSTIEANTIFDPSTDATKHGISLLSTKNELLLSYLHNLVFLIILKLRSISESTDGNHDQSQLGKDVIGKLVELKTYMDKGVKPLEGKLKYQIEKVIRAAEDADRQAAAKNAAGSKSKKHKSKINGVRNGAASSDVSSNASEDEDSDAESSANEAELDELSYRPNPAALQSKQRQQQTNSATSKNPTSASTGTYKPPRINPVSMPVTTAETRSRSPNRPQKSFVMEDYIADELSGAPTSHPSIGSNQAFTTRGRHTISQRERNQQAERKRYEEENFVRLPGESKAEKRKNKGRRGREDGGYGGEEFRGLGEIGDRVSRAVGRQERGGGGGGGSALARSRKRGLDEGDKSGSGGRVTMGEGFEKRRRVIEGRERRKKGR
ncbi:putative u3 small nucleolar ribonucleoprotein [Phaeomoniella chlamydospora]|uniref:Putative u3 small nucleolar ribonucleoprotein n=1 Tax=Phaeomoniella chlamydospora TaxID=158046 RepID=A0A0G2ECD2_PHACM|nr:putative u3 small nucleolar ribonucleoprotein [Phaeomoniella chlamydospora]